MRIILGDQPELLRYADNQIKAVQRASVFGRASVRMLKFSLYIPPFCCRRRVLPFVTAGIEYRRWT